MTPFLIEDSLVAEATDENIVDDTPVYSSRSKNSKVEVAADRFVDLFKRVAGRKAERKN